MDPLPQENQTPNTTEMTPFILQGQPSQGHKGLARIILLVVILFFIAVIVFLIYQNGKSIYTHGI